MKAGTKNFLGIAQIVLAILVALNQGLNWGGLQYLWAVLVAIGGIWLLSAKD